MVARTKQLRLTVGLIVALMAIPALARAGWFDLNWWDRAEVTLDNSASAEALTDFPVLVHLTGSDFNFSRAQANGGDVRFTDSDGTTLLNHEIEKWDKAGQEAWVWVKVPQIDAGSTTDSIYMYSMNLAAPALPATAAEQVWSNGYVMVHHLDETASAGSVVYDSTSNSLDGQNNADSTVSAPGIAGDAFSLAATGGAGPYDYVRVPGGTGSDTTLDLTSLTLEGWFKPSSSSSGDWSIHGGAQFGTSSMLTRFGAVIGDWTDGSGVAYTTTPMTVGQWSYIVGTADYDSGANFTSIAAYTDGVSEKTGGRSGVFYTQGSYYIGNSKDFPGSRGFPGAIDEVRLSSVARTADWVEAQFLSMTGDYVTFGDTQSIPEPTSALLLLGGLGALLRRHRRRS